MKGVKAYRGVGAGHCGVVSVEQQCLPLRGKTTTSEFACKLAALVVRRQARAAALPYRGFASCAGAGFISPGHVSFDADFSFCSVGRGLDLLGRSRKTLVGASIARPCRCFTENCPGKCVAAVKWAGDQWSPLHYAIKGRDAIFLTACGRSRPLPYNSPGSGAAARL